MSAPRNPSDALRWIKGAARDGRYEVDPHLWKQMTKRGIMIREVLMAIAGARSCEPYPGTPLRGGTCWRVHGRTGTRRLAIGCEAFWNGAEWILLTTTFEE